MTMIGKPMAAGQCWMLLLRFGIAGADHAMQRLIRTVNRIVVFTEICYSEISANVLSLGPPQRVRIRRYSE